MSKHHAIELMANVNTLVSKIYDIYVYNACVRQEAFDMVMLSYSKKARANVKHQLMLFAGYEWDSVKV